MPGGKRRVASAAAGAGGASESVFGAWAAAGAIFRQQLWGGIVSADKRAFAFSVSLFSCSHVWRSEPDSGGNSGRLYGSAGEAWFVRARTEHRADLDGRPARTGGDGAEVGEHPDTSDVGQQGFSRVCFVGRAAGEILHDFSVSNFSWHWTPALRGMCGGVQPGVD